MLILTIYYRTSRKHQLTRRLLPVGDGGPGRGRRSWRWRGSNATVQGVGSRYSGILKRIQEKRRAQEDVVRGLAGKERTELAKEVLEQVGEQA